MNYDACNIYGITGHKYTVTYKNHHKLEVMEFQYMIVCPIIQYCKQAHHIKNIYKRSI